MLKDVTDLKRIAILNIFLSARVKCIPKVYVHYSNHHNSLLHSILLTLNNIIAVGCKDQSRKGKQRGS